MAVLDNRVSVELPPVEPTTNGKPNPPRVYTIAGMGPGVRAEWTRIIKQKAWKELDDQGEFMYAARYQRLELGLMRDMGAGKYEWGGEIFNSIDGTPAGFRFMLLARVRIGTGEELDESVADEMIEKLGIDRLLALVQQSDGPQLKNSQAPDKKPGATNGTTNN